MKSKLSQYLATISIIIMTIALFESQVSAQINENNIIDGILQLFINESANLSSRLTGFATRLFFYLAVIELTYTGIRIALSGEGMESFFATLVNRVLYLGFFFALIQYSPDWARSIVESLEIAATQAVSGLSTSLSPSDILDNGFFVLGLAIVNFTVFSPVASMATIIAGYLILAVFAKIAGRILVLLVQNYIVLNAGVIVLGLGGSSWTSSYAIAYLRAAFAVGLQLFFARIIVGISESFMTQWVQNLDASNINQLGIILGASIVVMILVDEVPNMVNSLLNGVNIGSGAGLSSTATAVAGTTVGAAAVGYETARAAGAKTANDLKEFPKSSLANNIPSAPLAFGGYALGHLGKYAMKEVMSGSGFPNDKRAMVARFAKMGMTMREDRKEQELAKSGFDGGTITPADKVPSMLWTDAAREEREKRNRNSFSEVGNSGTGGKSYSQSRSNGQNRFHNTRKSNEEEQ